MRLGADAVTPSRKVRRVVLAEMGKRVDALFRRAWIEDNLDEAEKTIVFDDELHNKSPVQGSTFKVAVRDFEL